MTDTPETLSRYRTPWRSEHVKQAMAFAPLLRRVPKNPLFLIGAAAIGVAGVLAWRNRDRIAATAGPMIEEARTKGHAMIDDARAKGEELIEQAKTTTEAVAAKARRRKSPAAAVTPTTTEIH
jgi:hypothetical protein